MKRKKEKLEARVSYASGGKLSLEILSEKSREFQNGEIVEVVHDVEVNQRTASQNAFFQVMIRDMVQFFDEEIDLFTREDRDGNEIFMSASDKEEYLKMLVKSRILGVIETREVCGEIISFEVVPSTTELDVAQFVKFIDRCVAFFSSVGAPIDLFMRRYERDWLGIRGFSGE